MRTCFWSIFLFLTIIYQANADDQNDYKEAFIAGCNLVLHCNGKHKEMLDVAKNSPFIDNFIIKKTSQFYKILS